MSDPVPLHGNRDPRVPELARELREVIDRRAGGTMPYALVIGVLHILMQELYDELKRHE